MTKYTVDAEVTIISVPTTVESAGGNAHADAGMYLVKFSDDTGVAFKDRVAFEAVFGEQKMPDSPEEAEAKHKAAVAAGVKGAKTKARHERQAEAKAEAKAAPKPEPKVVTPAAHDEFSDRISKPFSGPWPKADDKK